MEGNGKGAAALLEGSLILLFAVLITPVKAGVVLSADPGTVRGRFGLLVWGWRLQKDFSWQQDKPPRLPVRRKGGSVLPALRLLQKAVRAGWIRLHGAVRVNVGMNDAAAAALLTGLLRILGGAVPGLRLSASPRLGQPGDRVLNNKNRLLSAYPGAAGVKTGYTKAAGRCLVFAAERDGLALIGVVLNCPDWFDTAAAMLDRGFDAWQMVTVPGKDETVRQIPVTGGIRDSVRALALQDVSALVKTDSWPDLVLALPDSLPAGVEKGQVIGSASLVDQGETLVTVPLYAAESVPQSSFRFLFARIGAQWLLGR